MQMHILYIQQISDIKLFKLQLHTIQTFVALFSIK